MFQRILVPLDDTERSERAIPVAARIARASGATIIFVHVVLPPVEFGTYSPERTVALKPGAFARREEEASTYLTGIILTHADDLAGLNTEIEVTSGAVASEISSAARLEAVDLIVICTQEETGLKRWLFGSVAQEVVRHSSVPVLVLQEQGVGRSLAHATHPLRTLVPLDGSAFSETVLLPAAQLMNALAAPFQGSVHLLRVVEMLPTYGTMKSQVHVTEGMEDEARQEAEKYVTSLAEQLHQGPFGAFKLTVTASVAVSTDVAGTILKEAEQATDADSSTRSDMIAMATHGRGGLLHLIMGSVAEYILGTTKLPLLLVRPQQERINEMSIKGVEKSERAAQAT